MDQENKKGLLVVITGPSGVGKDSVIEGLAKTGLKFSWINTITTRKRRKGEKEGNPYYFTDVENFKKMIENNEFVEWAEVYGNYYGSTYKEFEEKQKNNKIILLRPDPFGAISIKEKFPESLLIFIAPPSIEILRSRLEKRGKDSKDVIEKRLKNVEKEMKLADKFDEVVINKEGELDKAVERVRKIIEKTT